MRRSLATFVLLAVVGGGCWHETDSTPGVERAPARAEQLHRVTTAVPFPRGLQLVDGTLYVLARGRVREAGGVDGSIDDQAGTIFAVDPNVMERIAAPEVSPAVRTNGRVFAASTSPPFQLFDRTARPATKDRETDRPYCSLRYDAATKNFFLCAFSGIDKPEGPGGNFSKNTSDALLRFDTRDHRWRVVERHEMSAGGNYPHSDPAIQPPPHGWLNGPDNCLVVGRWLYAVAKDNSLLVRYDLGVLRENPGAAAPRGVWELDHRLRVRGHGEQEYFGHSMLATRDGWLYLGYRTSSKIVRIRLAKDGTLVRPIVGELIAQFDPYDPATRQSANLTDMVFGPDGDLYVVSAQPARLYRFQPDARRVFDGRTGKSAPWADLAQLTGNPKMKSENVLVDERSRVFVTAGDAYDFQAGAGGVVYCLPPG